jgi:hypothetical protein
MGFKNILLNVFNVKNRGKLNFYRFTQNPPDTKKLLDTPPELPDSLTYDHFGGKLSKLPFTPKPRRFGLAQNDVVLPKTASFWVF